MKKTGRNDPCPCGSGKKYKHCCLAAETAAAHPPEEMTWRRIRRELEGFATRMLQFMTQRYGAEAVNEAWWEFNLWDDEEEIFDPETPQIPVFMPWMFHHWTPNPDDTSVADTALHERSPTRVWLDHQGRRLSPLLREYLQACLQQPFSFFEVTHCTPGKGVEVRDVMTGQSHAVLERSASHKLRKHDMLYGQVVCVQGIAMLEGTSPIAFPPADKLAMIDLRKHLDTIDVPADLDEADAQWERAMEIRDLYLQLCLQQLFPSMPQLTTTDGEEMEFHRLIFDIDAPQHAFDALRHLESALAEPETLEHIERDASGAVQQAHIRWLQPGATDEDTLPVVLGDIHIDGKRLVAKAHSRERAARVRDIIEEALGAHATFRMDKVQTPQQALAECDPETLPDADLIDDPQAQALLSDYLHRHYLDWIDTALPVLDERTPRQAVQTAEGRERVEILLQQLDHDRQSRQVSLDSATIDELRQKLGLNASESDAE